MKKSPIDEQREKYMAGTLGLNDFNRQLFESGDISEKDYKTIAELIAILRYVRYLS